MSVFTQLYCIREKNVVDKNLTELLHLFLLLLVKLPSVESRMVSQILNEIN